jgi:hypothetical protein
MVHRNELATPQCNETGTALWDPLKLCVPFAFKVKKIALSNAAPAIYFSGALRKHII